jgi:hypothetical protein
MTLLARSVELFTVSLQSAVGEGVAAEFDANADVVELKPFIY